MQRISSKVPRYRKHCRGHAFVRLNGQDVYLGAYGTKRSRLEYDRVIAEWMANGRQRPTEPIAEKTTVVQVCAAYLKFAKGYYPGKTVQTRVVKAIRLLKGLYGRHPADDFGPLGLKAIRQSMIRDGASRRYVNDTIGQVKRIFKWAASEEMVSHEVFHKLQTVSGLAKGRTEARETEPVQPVSDDIVDQTLSHLPAIVQSMVKLQRLTGVRPAEVCIMRPMDIDRTADVWVFTPADHKNEWRGKKRQVAIGPKAQEVLRPFLLRPAKAYCFDPSETVEQWQRAKRQTRKTKVQPSQLNRSKAKPKRKPGNLYTTASYRRAIHRACDKAKVEQWSPNQLRHAMATEVRRELGLEAAQVALGHAKADVTQIYAEKNLALAAEVAKRLG